MRLLSWQTGSNIMCSGEMKMSKIMTHKNCIWLFTQSLNVNVNSAAWVWAWHSLHLYSTVINLLLTHLNITSFIIPTHIFKSTFATHENSFNRRTKNWVSLDWPLLEPALLCGIYKPDVTACAACSGSLSIAGIEQFVSNI